jgi:hypothetical protein
MEVLTCRCEISIPTKYAILASPGFSPPSRVPRDCHRSPDPAHNQPMSIDARIGGSSIRRSIAATATLNHVGAYERDRDRKPPL